jgi:glutamate carboxypeptidase
LNKFNLEKSGLLTEVLEVVRERQSEIVARIKKIVEVESPSGYETGSRAVVSLLEEQARELSWVTAVTRIPVNGYGEHLKIELSAKGSTDGQPVLLLGHTDTVHAVGSLALRPWRVENGRIYAPGIFDMKANCVMALEAIAAMERLGIGPSSPIVIMLMCDEETGSADGRAHVEDAAKRSKAVLVLEPPAPGGVVKTGRKGTGMFTVEVKGIASHAGLDPEKGASAILEMARQIERLHAMTDYSRGTTVNVGVVSGGTRANVVAENAKAEVDARFTSNEEGQRLQAAIKAAEPLDSRVKVSIRGTINRPPLERNELTLGLYRMAKSIAAEIGFDLPETQVGGASDGNFAAALGVAVLDGLGVDGDGAHAAHENIVIDDLPKRAALLAGLLSRL